MKREFVLEFESVETRTRKDWVRAGVELISSKEINYPATLEEKTLLVQEGNEMSLRQSPIVSCDK
jgi:hypothetical protein